MKYILTFFSIVALIIPTHVIGQCFKKGTLLVSISEGTTYSNYTTSTNTNGLDVINKGYIVGARDPLTLEYGLSHHWGIGLTMGGDILKINPATFYNLPVPGNQAKVITSEITVDGHYHYFVTKKTDLSFYSSFGAASVNLKGNTGDRSYQYNAGGCILRLGTQARYYLFRRFGIHGMASLYSASYNTAGIKGNTIANNYTTGISGFAWEAGFFFHFFR